MLSEQALHILGILEKKAGHPVTAKSLAVLSGISERSVKTYINEVQDFCTENGCVLLRKPGLGFIYQGSESSRKKIQSEHAAFEEYVSRNYRISYIVYVLLSGWSTYTISLFAEELEVSKKVISDDLDMIVSSLNVFSLKLNRIAGKGVELEGSELDKRKAFSHFCQYGINPCDRTSVSDYRLSLQEEKLFRSNYGNTSVSLAISVLQRAEKELSLWYTDYSFKMLAEYFAIQLMRIRQESYLECSTGSGQQIFQNEKYEFVPVILRILNESYGIIFPKEEQQYLGILLLAGELQNGTVCGNDEVCSGGVQLSVKAICDNLSDYIGEVFSVYLLDTDTLQNNLLHFLPASFIRAKYGFEIRNPFLQDVKTAYPGIFAISFALSGYYQKYAGALPNEQELSFLALFIGGAILRGKKHIKAVIIGSSGSYIANIAASRLEEKMPGLKVIATLSANDISELCQLNYDLLLTLSADIMSETEDTVHITPTITEEDIKNIDKAYFDKLSISHKEKFHMLQSLMPECLMFHIDRKVTKKELLKEICNYMFEGGYVKETYLDDVLKRESICSTSLGNGVAIPHGNSQLVQSPGVSVIVLKYPIEWGDDKVDIVCTLALNFENAVLTREFFGEFTTFVESEEHLKSLRESCNAEDLKLKMGLLLHER